MFVSASPRPRNYLLRSHLGKKRRMRSFFWKTIPEEQVRGKTNIWTLAARQQHHYQIDTKTIEELFGQQEDTTKSSLSRRGGTLNSSFRDAREEITIVDAKRSMNIGIFLKQFKKSPQSIVEDIHQGKSEHYGSETLREFLKLLPESEEVRNLARPGAPLPKPGSGAHALALPPAPRGPWDPPPQGPAPGAWGEGGAWGRGRGVQAQGERVRNVAAAC
uniref:FH2 domain containing 1 n=1 Tax=Canis lupus dingo TaxID=286419 RepID=A0A8C0JMC4_CANLU